MAPVVMEIKDIPEPEDTKEAKHVREIYKLLDQCNACKLHRPKTPTKDCAIYEKLIKDDSKVAWKQKHLFLNTNGQCKMFQSR